MSKRPKKSATTKRCPKCGKIMRNTALPAEIQTPDTKVVKICVNPLCSSINDPVKVTIKAPDYSKAEVITPEPAEK